MMNAFFDNIGQVQCGEQSGSQSRHPPTEEQTNAQDYEEEDAVGAFPQWCNAVTTQVGNPKKSLTREKPKDMSGQRKRVNGKAIRAMVDTGATHNYISSTEVERLGLTLEKGYGWVKTINSAAQPVAGIARSILIKIGSYEGRTNFLIVIMDDFKLILGLEFLRDTKATMMPCTNSLAMLGSKPVGSTNSVVDALSRRAELDQTAELPSTSKRRSGRALPGTRLQQLLKLFESGNNAFEIVNGQQPLLPHTVNVPNAGKSPRAIRFSEEWRQNIDLAHSYLEKAARRMKKHVTRTGDLKSLTWATKLWLSNCHMIKYEGPLTIVKKMGKMAYKVDPPHWWSRQLHPVFHVSMLKPFYEDTADPFRGQIKRQGLKPKKAGKRVAKAILNDRVITASCKRHQEYLVKWQGYMEEENTWE
ncbi:hypothetical protein RJ639_017825 [Escallonia herrerae]|uniref:Chromo domain-containing protein n=1 Tax=Escallonia herrerae TaxID=1293975 RepID=A0AA88VGV6_9ASTE|nr:hypothetical protein RJ639_017825 [Escallonia herrerae]